MPQVYALINKIMEPLCNQLFDLRSIITKEACKTISMMAEILAEEFTAHAPYFLSGTCLFKLMESANSVMAEHAHYSVLSIVHNIKHSKQIIKAIISQALGKHSHIRENCAEYLILVFLKGGIEKY